MKSKLATPKPAFVDPMLPLGHGKWKHASECSRDKLTEIIAFLEKNVETDARMADYNKQVLESAKSVLMKRL